MLTLMIAITLGGWQFDDVSAPARPAWQYRDEDSFPARAVPVVFASPPNTPGGDDTRSQVPRPRPAPLAPTPPLAPRWAYARDYPGWQVYGTADPVTGWIAPQSWRRVSAPPAPYFAVPRQLRCVGGTCR